METTNKNQVIELAERPNGIPSKSNFHLKDIDMPEITEGQVLLKNLYISVDAGMRGFMDKGSNDNTGQKFEIGKPITSRSVAQVIESKSKEFLEGDFVHGRLAWQKYQSFDANKL